MCGSGFSRAYGGNSSPAKRTGFGKELGIDPGSGVVLYTGNFEPYQGVERLLDAALGVVAEVPGTIFVLVGDETPSRFSRSKSAALLREQEP